ncbi:LysE/ArgO family amino acid transporter [Breoghania sp. L-A4]|uniref:LysE/ArgO family amino acid transporter n=1 Tax=Breoghania sp. L-A4 TaxID=2304600 RepID=UPI00196755A1|nr:LysE/ArgO family amino acid transporter [Breoghania sp. L-A4]
MFQPAIAGFFLGASLIIAIGAQNAFLLRQGLLRQHVLLLVLICAASDALLIAAGVAGLGSLVRGAPSLLPLVTLAGAAFLLVYGALALRRAVHPGVLSGAGGGPTGWAPAALTCLTLTWANPHVYLDTVVLIGGLSARYGDAGRLAFGGGAVAASFAWFFALGYGARLLAPVFARPLAWRVLDGAICAIMWTLAGRLLSDIL